MDEITRKLAARDRFIQNQTRLQTPDELMREMWQLQQATWDRMQRIPELWNAYKREQFRKRAIHARREFFE